MTQCSTMNRNFCASSGEIAALFLDLDGTCFEGDTNFKEAAESFAHYMGLLKFDRELAKAHFDHLNLTMTSENGFRRELYAEIMVETYRQLCKINHRRFSAETHRKNENILRNIGNGPFFRPPILFPDTAEVLARARNSFLMIAVSIGSRDAQKYKISRGKLKSIFDHTIFTAKDNKLEYVQQAIKDLNINPHHSAFIGNSVRSDGACLAATNFIHLQLESGWAFDTSQALPQNTGFRLITASDWAETEEKGINSLLRRRKLGRNTGGDAASISSSCDCN